MQITFSGFHQHHFHYFASIFHMVHSINDAKVCFVEIQSVHYSVQPAKLKKSFLIQYLLYSNRKHNFFPCSLLFDKISSFPRILNYKPNFLFQQCNHFLIHLGFFSLSRGIDFIFKKFSIPFRQLNKYFKGKIPRNCIFAMLICILIKLKRLLRFSTKGNLLNCYK